MEKIIKKYLEKCRKDKRKRFHVDELEKYVIESYKGYDFYNASGGYFGLYKAIILLKDSQMIKEINSSEYNGINPPLKTRWQIIYEDTISGWEMSKILQLSDYLDFSYYKNNPAYQTEIEWEYIENIHKFLKSRDKREWVSVEERSLELFYDEKFLSDRKETVKGKYGILKRLKLSHEDLKMIKYGEMFVYWNKGLPNIKNIVILENHSTFFTYKRMAEIKGSIFGFEPDAIIYGEGKKIENSLSFLGEITHISKVNILYFGDMDSEGFGIYSRLKDRYPHIKIGLHQEAYKHLISVCNRYYPSGGNGKNLIYLNCFLEEMEDCLDDAELEKIKYIWDKDYRIPQELINLEYLLKVE